jgi:hypothetical protein
LLEQIKFEESTGDRRGWVTVEGHKELHFHTIDELKQHLMRSSITPHGYEQVLAQLERGLPVSLFVTAGQLSAFYG